MLSGNILDVYPDYQKNVIVTWLLQKNGRTRRVEDHYEPSFYVYSTSKDLSETAKILGELPQVKYLQCTAEKIVLGSPKSFMVLEVVPKTLDALHTLARLVDSWGGFHMYHLFNVDLRLPSRYLQDRGVFCHAWVRWDGNQFLLDDEQWALDYDIPLFKKIRFNVKQNQNRTIRSFHDPITSVVIDDEVIAEENEVDTILSAVDRIHQIDPDIILTENGDTVLLPFLYHRATVCGIQHQVNLGREEHAQKNSLRPVKQGKSYF
ncbi:MAG: 3'-5' exonuclease, partial [Methanobacteriota archaeon]